MRRKRRAVMHARTAGAGRIDGVREEVMDIGHIQPQHLGGQVTGKSYLSILSTLSILTILSILSYPSILSYLCDRARRCFTLVSFAQ